MRCKEFYDSLIYPSWGLTQQMKPHENEIASPEKVQKGGGI